MKLRESGPPRHCFSRLAWVLLPGEKPRCLKVVTTTHESNVTSGLSYHLRISLVPQVFPFVEAGSLPKGQASRDSNCQSGDTSGSG
jgi:hypothetical protein